MNSKNTPKNDLFVISPSQHTVLRGAAAFVAGPYCAYRGYQNNDKFLLTIGLLTMLIDSYTFYKSFQEI